MAIDTKSLTQIITDFRQLQSKDAISPESLGSILQRIADLLASAGTSETVAELQKLLNGFKLAGQAITVLSQGQSDRNHIYANKSTVNLTTGEVATTSELFIQQATTERAGAMRAQQVTDLNAARKGVTELQKQVADINSILEQIQDTIDGSDGPSIRGTKQLAVRVENGVLRVSGHDVFKNAGCVPYIFRLTKKRNQYHHLVRQESDKDKKYCAPRKGWNLWGSMNSVQVSAGVVQFSMNTKTSLHWQAVGWTSSPSGVLRVYKDGSNRKAVTWGRTKVSLHDTRFSNKLRMLRFRFAIAYGKPFEHGCTRVTPSNMSSNLAEFSLIFDPASARWYFGK